MPSPATPRSSSPATSGSHVHPSRPRAGATSPSPIGRHFAVAVFCWPRAAHRWLKPYNPGAFRGRAAVPQKELFETIQASQGPQRHFPAARSVSSGVVSSIIPSRAACRKITSRSMANPGGLQLPRDLVRRPPPRAGQRALPGRGAGLAGAGGGVPSRFRLGNRGTHYLRESVITWVKRITK
jgi:hypothetical protein